MCFCLKNTSIGWRAEQSGATQLSHIDGDLGEKPLVLGDFLISRVKKLLQRHLDHISHVFKAI